MARWPAVGQAGCRAPPGGLATVIAVPAAAVGVTGVAAGGGLVAHGSWNLGKDVQNPHWNNQATGNGGTRKVTPKEYSHFDDNGSGIMAELDENETPDTAIKVPDELEGTTKITSSANHFTHPPQPRTASTSPACPTQAGCGWQP
jgi:hypothetical protein